MQVSFLLYLAGVILLVLPVGPLARKRLKIATLEEISSLSYTGRRFGWLHPLNFIDLVRGYGGLSLLIAAFTLVEPSAPGQLVTRVVLGLAALLGLLMQQSFFGSDDEIAAPVAYSIGLTLAILPPQVGLLAVPIGAVVAISMNNLSAGLVLSAAVIAVLGKLLGQSLTTVGTASVLMVTPVACSIAASASPSAAAPTGRPSACATSRSK